VAVPDSLVRLARQRFPMRGPRIIPLSELQTPPVGWGPASADFFDYQIPLLSILTRFLRDPSSVPPAALRTNLAPRRVLPGGFMEAGESPLRVGLCPCAQENGVSRPHRSIPALALLPLRDVPGVEWISLLPDKYTDWVRPMKWLKDPEEDTWDWESTAQVIERLDLVISVDTAVAHLAGSLRKATWLLLPLRCDWKYQLPGMYLDSDRGLETSLWYPGMRLFRQRHPTDWSGVIQEVCAELAKVALTVPV